jgi:antirestriction protein ArdC
MKKNVAEIITDAIISKLEAGVVPWKKPWNAATDAPRNLITGKSYRGINSFLLASSGFSSPYFLTFKQCCDKGGQIKAGEKGLPVVFWSTVSVEDRSTGDEKEIPFMRYYTVFNAEQTTIALPAAEKVERAFNPIEAAERIVADMPDRPDIRYQQSKAFYHPLFDFINMPKQELFCSDEAYFGTLYHELGHSTGNFKRIGRKGVTETSYFGSHEYSKEELIAEMTAAFLCAEAGIVQATIDNSAAYISGWLRALKAKDNRAMVIQAASQAQKAADYVLGIQNSCTERIAA